MKPVRFLRSAAMRRGVLGSSRPWFVVWATLTGFRMVRRMTTREPKVVFSQTLKPGETLVIAAGREPADA